MKILLFCLFGLSLFAVDFTSTANFQVKSTPIAARICYTVLVGDAGNTGTWEISESNTYSPLIHDVNTSLFSGSNADTRNSGATDDGTSNRRCFVVNALSDPAKAYAPVASDGKRYSRALRASTTYYGRITMATSGNTATVSFTTPNILAGDSSPIFDVPPDPTTPGQYGLPTIDFTRTDQCYNDMRFGTCWQVYARPDMNADASLDEAFRSPSYQATGWTTPDNIFTDDANFAVTSNTNPIAVVTDTVDSNPFRVGGMTFYIKGYVADACSAGDDRRAQVALMIDGVNAYGPYIDVTLPTQTAYGAGVETAVGDAASFPAPYMLAWLNPGQVAPYYPNLDPRVGNYTRSGTTITFSYSGSTNSFDALNWVNGSHIVLDTGGTPTETTIASISDAFTATVTTGSGPSSPTVAGFKASNFGFLIRKKTATCSMSITYVHVVKFHYKNPALNGGSGASRQSTTRRYPEGWRVTGASGSPVVVTVAGPDATTEMGTTEAIRIAGILGCTSINGNHTIQSRTATTVTLENGSTCNASFSGDGALWRTAAKTGFVVQAGNEDGIATFYWIDPDTTPKEVRYLGQQFATSAAFSSAPLAYTSYNLSDGDADLLKYYDQISPTADPTKYHVYEGTYVGDATFGLFRDVGQNAGGVSQFRWTDKANLTDQLVAFDAGFDLTTTELNGLIDSTHLVMSARYGVQNTKGWVGVYDIGTFAVSALGRPYRAPDAWGCGNHTVFAYTGQSGVYVACHEMDGQDTGNGPYWLTTTDNGANTTTPSDCATLLSGLGLSNPLGVSGNNCNSVTVSSTTLTLDGGGSTAGTVQTGMWLYFATSGNVFTTEAVRVAGVSGTTLVLLRNAWLTGPIVAQPSGSKLMFGGTPNSAIVALNTFVGWNNHPYYGHSFWWDWVNDPHMTNANDSAGQQNGTATVYVENEFSLVSHPSGRSNVFVTESNAFLHPPTCPNQTYGAKTAGYRIGDYKSTQVQCVNINPAWDGIPGSTSLGQDADPHLSNGCVTGGCTDTFFQNVQSHQNSLTWGETVTKVVGRTYIYKVTNYCTYSGGICDYKRQTIGVLIGTRAGVDVSAAGFDYATNDDSTHWYTFCRALKTNDCISGSAADDVYVNAPFVANRPTGYIDGTGYGPLGWEGRYFVHDQNDINVFMVPVHGNQVVQYGVSATTSDPTGRSARRLGVPMTEATIPVVCAKCLGLFNENVSVLADGSAALTGIVMVNQPSYPGIDSTDRTTWIPVDVASGSVPANTTNAYVKFGYDSSFNCSSRRETCIANASTIQTGASVYSYLTSDTWSGLACSSGCTIRLPAMSQRIMWYQFFFRDSMNMSTGTSSLFITTSDPPPTGPGYSRSQTGRTQRAGRTQ